LLEAVALKKIFEEIRKIAPETKIVLAGGKKIKEEKFLEIIKMAMEANLNGILVGRNLWQAENSEMMAQKIKEIIFGEF